MGVVALTGFGQEQAKARAANAGFHAHLTKPADPAALADLLRQCSAARNLRRPTGLYAAIRLHTARGGLPYPIEFRTEHEPLRFEKHLKSGGAACSRSGTLVVQRSSSTGTCRVPATAEVRCPSLVAARQVSWGGRDLVHSWRACSDPCLRAIRLLRAHKHTCGYGEISRRSAGSVRKRREGASEFPERGGQNFRTLHCWAVAADRVVGVDTRPPRRELILQVIGASRAAI